MNEEKYEGALIDERSEAEKAKDYKFEELVANVNPVTWVEKNQSQWRKFPIFDQDGSGSCVAQTVAKMLGVMYQQINGDYVHFSATHVYQRRNNKPQGGMAGTNALDIARQGVTLEALVPSQKMSDAQMDAVKIPEYKNDVGESFCVKNYVILPTQDIETVASVIQTTGKPVMVWYWFKHDEWTHQPTIKYPSLTTQQGSRHSVTAVDFCLVNGKKCLIIDDSWGTSYGQKGQRVITEDWHNKRNFFAAYLTNFKFDEEVDTNLKPKYTFTRLLKLDMRGDDVVALQKCLQYEGYYPTNTACTGYFGAVTKAAVVKFQNAYGLIADGVVGTSTMVKLNKRFSN